MCLFLDLGSRMRVTLAYLQLQNARSTWIYWFGQGHARVIFLMIFAAYRSLLWLLLLFRVPIMEIWKDCVMIVLFLSTCAYTTTPRIFSRCWAPTSLQHPNRGQRNGRRLSSTNSYLAMWAVDNLDLLLPDHWEKRFGCCCCLEFHSCIRGQHQY